jgi:prepilin peptidase CpaA
MNAAMYAQHLVVPAAIAVLAIAVYTDCRWRLIHNGLTLPAIGLGLLLQLAGQGWAGLVGGLLGMAAGFGLMMIPFSFGQMGGGDVKLMAALGSLLGAYAILNVFLYTTLAGGMLALGYAVRFGRGVDTLRRAGQLATGWVKLRGDAPCASLPARAITIPYGVAIAAGTLLYLAAGNVV